MLSMLDRLTHQVAFCLLSPEMTHCPPQTSRSDFNPSTALLESVKCPGMSSEENWLSWWVVLFKAKLSEEIKILHTFQNNILRLFLTNIKHYHFMTQFVVVSLKLRKQKDQMACNNYVESLGY